MRGFYQWLWPALLLASSANGQTEPGASPSVAPPADVIAWVRANAAPVKNAEIAPGSLEAVAVDRVMAGATVIGMGESGHGNAEPLDYRNRLIRYLVQHRGLSAVALESGLAESRALDAYIGGEPGDPEHLTRAHLTHGFGFLPQNVELVRWLRAWNADPRHSRVHLYGIDLSGIQSAPEREPASVVLSDVTAHLARIAPGASAAICADLARFMSRFDETDWPNLSADNRLLLRRRLAEADALIRARPQTTAADAFAAREAFDARQLPDVFDAWVIDPNDTAKLMHLIALRDRAMAEHLLWALAREGPRGRVLLFQANGHVAAEPLVGSYMRVFPSQPPVTGVLLRERLGAHYRVLATVSSRGRAADDPTLGSVDRAFAAAGANLVLLPLDAPRRSSWWDRTQGMSQAPARVDDAAPASTFDGLLYFRNLTPLPPPSLPKSKP